MVPNGRSRRDPAMTAVPPIPAAPPIRVAIASSDVSRSGPYTIEISYEVLDAIAQLVLELQREVNIGHQGREHELLTVSELAARLRVNPKWVYAHQIRLGAIRLGEGPKARLRFPASAVAAEVQRQQRSRDAPPINSEGKLRPMGKRRRRLPSRPVPAIEPSRPQA
jgi:hypothetical protein